MMNLATRFRPLSFDEIKGQDVCTQMLRHAFETDQVASSYLCVGKHGTGKTSCARIIGRLLLCSNRVGAVACGECLNCQNSARDACPDLKEFDASNLGKEDIKALKADAHYRPMFGDKKIYIIDEAHNLSSQGFQALLKILEEPPEYVYFILATTEFSKVPKTILSRCQKLTFVDLPEALIVERLTELVQLEQAAITEDMVQLIAKLGEGSLRDAITILESVMTNRYTTVQEIYTHFGIPNEQQVKNLAICILQGDMFAYAKVLTELEVVAKLNLDRCYTMLLDHLSHRLLVRDQQVGRYYARLLMYLMVSQSLFSNPHLKKRQVFDTIVMRAVDEVESFRTPSLLQEISTCV